MNRLEILEQVNGIFRDVFDDASIAVSEGTTAADIEEWDSLSHITLLSEVEAAFDFKFGMGDVLNMKNVGEMLDIIQKHQ